MTDTDTTTTADEATIAGSTGFVLSIDWEADGTIDEVLERLCKQEYTVAVTFDDDERPPINARMRQASDGTVIFVPWDTETDQAVPGVEPIAYDAEVIDGVHVY